MDAKVGLFSLQSYLLRSLPKFEASAGLARVSRVHGKLRGPFHASMLRSLNTMLTTSDLLQPQRPLRTLRVREDENVPPAFQNAKTIHQRNKSSPALSTMLGGGGIKAAAKRTAFGDVSNTFSGARPSKDDSTIPTKSGLPVAGKSTQVMQEKRSTAFLRPAQRPLSVSGLRGLLTGVTVLAASDSTTRQTGAEVGTTSQVANTRKVLTKRTTTIFKDPSLDTVDEVAIEASQHIIVSSIPAPSQAASRPIPSLRPSTKEAPISKDPVKESRRPSPETIPVQVSEAPADAVAVSSETRNVEASKPDGTYPDDEAVLRGYQVPIPDVQEVERPVATMPVKQTQPAPAKSEAHVMVAAKSAAPILVSQPIVSQHPQPTPSEPEEYWDEEEEDNYDEEGYVTARSYRSRGESTTGGATTVLFPHANQKVKRELAAAKEIVEATRTAEEIEDECYDTSMVAEYGDEIFDYMKQLEVCKPPTISISYLC
jgi:G2/mitotic-specific cyclin 3/4